jgi:hypothetical protein
MLLPPPGKKNTDKFPAVKTLWQPLLKDYGGWNDFQKKFLMMAE